MVGKYQSIHNDCFSFLLLETSSKRLVFLMKNMNCFRFHLHVRQHTLAFIPSSGKIDSFGLGGNGQLGTRSTCNRISPAPVKGCWRAHTDPVPMEVGALTLST